MKKNFAFRLAYPLSVVVNGPNIPSDKEWDDYLDAFRGFDRPKLAGVRTLIYANGGPDGRQRLKLNELLSGVRDQMKSAVLCHSASTRGIITAISWFNPGIRAFGANEFSQGCEHLELTNSQQLHARSIMRDLLMDIYGTVNP